MLPLALCIMTILGSHIQTYFVDNTPGVAGAASPWFAGAAQSYSTKPSVRNVEQQTHGVNHITEPSVVHSTKIVEDVA